jgi:hypothetical protein
MLTQDKHHEIRFNPTKQTEISTTGSKNVCFWDWEGMKLEGYMARISKTDFGHYSGKFTSTIFFANTGNALTATEDGYVIVWGNQFSNVLLDDPSDRNIKMASKVSSPMSHFTLPPSIPACAGDPIGGLLHQHDAHDQ